MDFQICFILSTQEAKLSEIVDLYAAHQGSQGVSDIKSQELTSSENSVVCLVWVGFFFPLN